MKCGKCGGTVEWQGPLSNLTHTLCLDCGGINCQEIIGSYDLELEATDEDGELAQLGQALLNAIRVHAYPGWSPAQCPSEIVGDLRNECDELREKLRLIAPVIGIARVHVTSLEPGRWRDEQREIVDAAVAALAELEAR